MAIWQFECNIIPNRENINGLSIEEILSWKDVSTPTNNIEFIEREASWSKDIVQYGKTNETCIDFICVDNMLNEIDCRLDLRNLTKKKLASLIKYVKEIDAMFLVEGKIYKPEIKIMIEVMKESKANQYCKNPLEYLMSIEKQNNFTEN